MHPHALTPSSSKTNGIFELKVTNEAKEEAVWTIDMKKTGTVYKGAAKPKADVTIILSDDVLVQLAEGKASPFLHQSYTWRRCCPEC